MLLLPYQQEWLRDTSGFKLWSKSRRIGASWCEAGDCALQAAQTKGSNVFYIAYEKEMTRTFIEDVADWARTYSLAASQVEESQEIWRDGDEDKAIQVFRIYFNSGFRVEALSSAPRNLRSKQGRVVIDEAAFHDDLPALLKAAKALRLWGSPIHIISTYNGTEEPYYELEQDVLAGKLPYSRHFTTFRDAVEQGLYQRICLVKGWTYSKAAESEWLEATYAEFGSDAEEELDCIPRASSGAYLSRITIENCMAEVPIAKWKCSDQFAILPEAERDRQCSEWIANAIAPLMADFNPNLKSYFGEDFGRYGDLTVFLFGQLLPNLTRASRFAVELRNIPHEQQRQILFWICDRLPCLMGGGMDARGNGNYLAEVTWQRYGQRIHKIQASLTWYGTNFPSYRAALQDRKVLIPQHADWLSDHRAVITNKGIPQISDRDYKGTDGERRHGDSAIACLNFWYASCQSVGAIEWEAVENSAHGRELAGFRNVSLAGY
jgi:phage FluMu gp28-like protein